MTPQDFGFTKVCYSVNETMQLLSISRWTLYDRVKRGELKPTKLGKKTLFYASDLAVFLANLRERREPELHV